MKKITLIAALFVLLIPHQVWAACSGASPNLTAASANYSDVNDCVSIATYNDTVSIPTGSVNWNDNVLNISKGISLNGAGVGQTIITNARNAIIFTVDSYSASNDGVKFVITGIEFRGTSGLRHRVTGTDNNYYYTLSNNPQTNDSKPITGASWSSYWASTDVAPTHIWTLGASYEYSISAIRILNTYSNAFEKVIIKDCKFKNWGEGVNVWGNVYGIIANSIFIDVGTPSRAMGDGYSSWTDHPFTYGTANNLYLEDNSISFENDPGTADISHGASQGFYGWAETGQGGRISYRYNTWDLSNCTSGEIMFDMWDAHGDTSGASGTMGIEYYGNKIYNNTSVGFPSRRLFYHRGGQGLAFYNSWAWSTGGTPIINLVNEVNHIDTEYINNSYYFINLQNGIEIVPTLTSDSYGQVNENAQWFKYNASCTASSCSSGVGCGSATPTGTCTAGVGFWKTSQSCSDLTGMIGASPATPISGTLYKCTATNTWTAYYAPYTYPHPLRSIITQGTGMINSGVKSQGVKWQ